MGNNITLRAHKGIVYSTVVLVLGSLAALTGYVVIMDALEGKISEDPLRWTVSLVGAGALGCMAIGYLSSVVLISEGSIKTKSLFGRNDMEFRDVTQIKVAPLYGNTVFLGFNVVLLDKNRRGIDLYASYYSNRHEILKAVLEGACHWNAQVVIDKSLTDAYGHPPYGIFKSKE